MNKQILFVSLILFSGAFASADAVKCVTAYSDSATAQFSNVASILNSKRDPFEVARAKRPASKKEAKEIMKDVENHLLTEEVETIEFLGGGVTESFKVTFKSGLKAVYKPVNPDRANQPIREVVAYRISQLFDLFIAPPTVMRELKGNIPSELRGRMGSVQLFVTEARVLQKGKDSGRNKVLLFEGKEFDPDSSQSGRRLRIFDWLINNHDRGSNAGNYLVSLNDTHVIGIDHSVSFVGFDKVAREDKVPYYKKDFLTDREMYTKLTAVTEADIRDALKGLNPVRVDEFLIRYKALIKDFEKVLNKENE